MCWRELLDRLGEQHPGLSPTQIRWAITTGKVRRPPLDASLRFVFGEDHLRELVEYFGSTNHNTGDDITG